MMLATLLMILTACDSAPSGPDYVAELAAIAPVGSGDRETADLVREFVHASSFHDPVNTFTIDPYDVQTMAKEILEGRVPILYCGHRARLMGAILERRGVRSRVINYLTSHPLIGMEYDSGHVLLEVYNPETAAWEVQDPDYNVIFAMNDAPETRLGAVGTLTTPKADFAPCGAGVCSWGVAEVEQYLEAVIIVKATPVLYYNPERVDNSIPYRDGEGMLTHYSGRIPLIEAGEGATGQP